MQLSQSPDPTKSAPARQMPRFFFLATFVIVTAIAIAAGAAEQAPPGSPDRPYLLPEANRLPDVNEQMKMRDKETKQENYEVANTERKKQISDDSTKLLTLAMSLKAEVDKTNKDTLSLNVIRKADEIEKLAHNVKEKMKLSVGGN
jgi:hypothetical protein